MIRNQRYINAILSGGRWISEHRLEIIDAFFMSYVGINLKFCYQDCNFFESNHLENKDSFLVKWESKNQRLHIHLHFA